MPTVYVADSCAGEIVSLYVAPISCAADAAQRMLLLGPATAATVDGGAVAAHTQLGARGRQPVRHDRHDHGLELLHAVTASEAVHERTGACTGACTGARAAHSLVAALD